MPAMPQKLQGEWWWLTAGYVAAVLVMGVAIAYASPPDPVWISGIYDDRDADDVVVMLTNGTGINDAQEEQRVEDDLVGSVTIATIDWMPISTVHHQAVRGPPIDGRDADAASQAISISPPLPCFPLEPPSPHPGDTNPDGDEAFPPCR